MRAFLVAVFILLGTTMSARAAVNVSVNIGINVPAFPNLVVVPGYPVYYAPDADGNYFFYDGQYWVFDDDNWYASSWYNGPWVLVEPLYVPVFVLRVPVRYYHRPPAYFASWSREAPPRWGDHWGPSWQQRHAGWDRWDRKSVPRAAPLPVYQRDYSGNRYPRSINQQQTIRGKNYHYQERDAATQHVQQRIRSEVARPTPNAQPRPMERRQQSNAPRETPQRPTPQPSAPQSSPKHEPRSTPERAPAPPQREPQRESQREPQQRGPTESRGPDRERPQGGDNRDRERGNNNRNDNDDNGRR